jgi:hypothetical protein
MAANLTGKRGATSKENGEPQEMARWDGWGRGVGRDGSGGGGGALITVMSGVA